MNDDRRATFGGRRAATSDRSRRFARWWVGARLGFCGVLLPWLAGCGRDAAWPEGRTSPNPSAPARYGAFQPRPPPESGPETKASAAGAAASTAPLGDLLSGPFCVVESELSPAVLVRSQGKYLGLFSDLSGHGLGGPSHVAWSTAGGPRSFKPGDSIDVTRMEENWILVWFAGAAGWTNWDVPWAIYLQHRLAGMKLDSEGLHLSFSNRVGDVALMPLYGFDKLPLKDRDERVAHGLPPRKPAVKTWEWAAALPRDALIRARYWAGATRRWPLDVEERVRLNAAEDTVTFRWAPRWHEIEDDWRTKPLRVVPISPTLGLALQDAAFPVKFSEPPFDLGMFTPYGPSYGVSDVDAVEATMRVLQYVQETEAPAPGGLTNVGPGVTAAQEQLVRQARNFVALSARDAESDPAWAGAAGWAARAVPSLPPADRTNVLGALRTGLDARLRAEREVGGRKVVDALWAYSHSSGDWDLARGHWPRVKAAADFGDERSWAGFGPEHVSVNGDLGGEAIALARLAYQAGDGEAYGRACARVASELVQLWVKLRGAELFRDHQPLHSFEWMEGPVYLTEVDAQRPGWWFDGPQYPAVAESRLSRRRWDRFFSADVARYLLDYLGASVRRDTGEWLQITATGTGAGGTAAGIAAREELAWGEQVRSLLREEVAAGKLGAWPAVAATNSFAAIGDALGVAVCGLRLAGARQYERLMPPAAEMSSGLTPAPAPVGSIGRGLVVQLRTAAPGAGSATVSWPELGWASWRTPVGGVWSFGQIKGARRGTPRAVATVPVNRHTRVIRYEMP